MTLTLLKRPSLNCDPDFQEVLEYINNCDGLMAITRTAGKTKFHILRMTDEEIVMNAELLKLKILNENLAD